MKEKTHKTYTRKHLITTSIISSIIAVALFIALVFAVDYFQSGYAVAEDNEGYITHIESVDDSISRDTLKHFGGEYLTGISQVINVDQINVGYYEGEYIVIATVNREMLGYLTGDYLSKRSPNERAEYVETVLEPIKLAQRRLESKVNENVYLEFVTHDSEGVAFATLSGDYVESFFLEEYHFLKYY